MFSSLRMMRSGLRTISQLQQTMISMQNTAPIMIQTRKFSEAAPQTESNEAVIENLVKQTEGFASRAIRDSAIGKYKNLPLSPRKLELMCRMIRGLSVREATAQLLLSQKRKSVYLRRGLRTVSTFAVNNYNMTGERLIIDEVYATKGQHYKRIDIKGRGRASVKYRRHAHLVIKLKEQPYRAGEFRIGRFGRTITGWKKVDQMVDAWKQKEAAL